MKIILSQRGGKEREEVNKCIPTLQGCHRHTDTWLELNSGDFVPCKYTHPD